MKNILINLLNFFLSLRTAIWLTLALLFFLLFGSIIMPLREEFQALHSVPLLPWLVRSSLGITWWLWAAIVILSLLAVNTLLCSAESILRKRGSRQWLLILSPQVIHAGFLFILLAHLLSSAGGFKGTAYVNRGTMLQLPDGLAIQFDEINTQTGPSGYLEDYSADVKYYRDGRQIAADVIRPNSPSFQEGFGVYIKTVQMEQAPTALIEVSREPGALWALIGGILFLTGITSLLMLKIKREDAQGMASDKEI